MTCIIRAAGTNFDVDSFIAKSPLVVDSFWRKCERRFICGESSDATNSSSGIRIAVSQADFSELSLQIEDVIVFLRQNLEAIKTLVFFPGVEGVVLDFGAEVFPPGWASFTFHPELLLLAGSAGVALCLSVYPTEPESEADASRARPSERAYSAHNTAFGSEL